MDVVSLPIANAISPAAPLAVEQAPDVGELRRRILEHVFELSEPVPPPALWAQFGSMKYVRSFSFEPAELLSKLRHHYSPDQLLAARVVVPTKTGDLELAAPLRSDDAFLIRGDATSRAADDIVSHCGKLSSVTYEWRELVERTRQASLKSRTPVVLCASDAELYTFARVGVSCTPMADVNQLTGKKIRELFKKRAEHAQQRCNQLVLLGWQPETFVNEPSVKNLAAIRHIAAVQPLYGFDPGILFSVWLPSKAELETVRRAHSFVDRELVASALRTSLQNSLHAPGDALTLLADRQPATWSEAYAALERAVERSQLIPQIAATKVALDKLEQAYRDQVLRPLENASTIGGMRSMQLMFCADLARGWFKDLEIACAARRVITGQFPGNSKRFDDEALKRKLGRIKDFINLSRLNFEK